MNQFTTPDQLQKFFKSNDRIKFSVKVFYVLQFVEENPVFINECGAKWCSDGIHFISNAALLGETLSIKPNTINTNFRSHYFKVISSSTPELISDFPSLTDAKNWKKRINQQYNFSSQTSIDEINSIPCQSLQFLRSLKRNIFDQNFLMPYFRQFQSQENNDSHSNETESSIFSDVPQETLSILLDDHDTLLSTVLLMNKVTNKEKRRSLIIHATEEWIKITGRVSRTNLSIIVDAIMKSYRATYDTLQLRVNVSYLLFSETESTQQDEILTFSQFFDFFLKYGAVSRAAFIIDDLTQKKIESGDQSDLYSSSQEHEDIFSKSNSQTHTFCSSYLCKWFQPTFDASVSRRVLENQPVNTWLLRPSSTPCRFTIHYKRRKSNSATYIEFDPLCPQDEPPFSVMIVEKGIVKANSLHVILFNELGLNENDCLSLDKPNNKIDFSDSPVFLSSFQDDIPSSQQYFD